VHRKRYALVLIVGLLLTGMIGLAFPGSAGAAIVSRQWAETAYAGTDDFYGTTVYAYEAGSTAKLTVKVYNGESGDVTIKDAKIQFDWGQEYAATVWPAEISQGEYGLVNFEFEVPSIDVASNKVLHSYTIVVGYQIQGSNYIRNWVANQSIGTGNGVTTVFSFPGGHFPLVADSLVLWFVDTSANTITPVASTAYTLDVWNNRVTFTSAPGTGVQIRANYRYCDYVGSGNDYNTVFQVGYRPVVSGSLRVFLLNSVTETVNEVSSTAYTFVPETGKITMTTAPTGFEWVYATYEYYTRWSPVTGSDFAVYSADQADARELRTTYNNMGRPGIFPSADGSQLAEEADTLAGLGNTAYQNGNFSAAKDYYQQAIDKLNAAIEADSTLNGSIEDILTGIGTGGASWIDSQAAKGDAEAAKLQAEADQIKAMTDAEVDKVEAEAGFAHLYGVFLILVGAAGLLAGVGGILWAASRLVAARRM
jgi:hypothetical protein